MEKKVVLRSKFKEWVETPVVEIVIEALKRELDNAYQQRAEAFVSGDPILTHEVRAKCLGAEAVLQDMIDVLSGDIDAREALFTENNIEVVDDE